MVYNWLYTFVHKDTYECIFPNRMLSKVFVIFVSALVHEILIYCILKKFIPILFVFYFVLGSISALLNFKNQNVGRIFFLYTYSLSNAILICAYAMEYYTRSNVTDEDAGFFSCFVPKFVSMIK